MAVVVIGVSYYIARTSILEFPSNNEDHHFLLSDVYFRKHKQKLEESLARLGRTLFHRPITAFLEPPMEDRVPGTGTRGSPDDPVGIYPQYKVPLPLRTHGPATLTKIQYGKRKIQTCMEDIPTILPVDRGLQLDENGNTIAWNLGGEDLSEKDIIEEAQYCPVEMDPFLPWIHDMFPSPNGTKIHFIAQNKRRCRTGDQQTNSTERLIPQVTLMQPVSVQRIDEKLALKLAPELWTDDNTYFSSKQSRYRLVPIEEADEDGKYTRFICRFTTIDPDTSKVLFVDETLSQYPFNYEFLAYRKGAKPLWTEKAKDSTLFWTSTILFDCPVPQGWHERVANGDTILSDGTPTLFVNLIPIRTSPRRNEVHLSEDLIGPLSEWEASRFDPLNSWGTKQVLPLVEASGRIENLPICYPPSPFRGKEVKKIGKSDKPHFLSACLWASAKFKTRGVINEVQSDTLSRLKEWILFHLMVGFDHLYIYDNSAAHSRDTDLSAVTDLFPDKVTRIVWPSTVCNNNRPAHDSTGERSSQYAAENSCRTRYSPYTEWIAAFDADEYLVPMGGNDDMREVLKNAAEKGTKIISFKSSRGHLRLEHTSQKGNGLVKRNESLFLEAYNCDRAGLRKPGWASRARKQIYLSDYVLYHWVHFATVTRGMLHSYTETKKMGKEWSVRVGEHPPIERMVDDQKEATMVHTKEVLPSQTMNIHRDCHRDSSSRSKDCFLAFPWPNSSQNEKLSYDKEGFLYNCYINEKVENQWIPKLKRILNNS